MSVRFEITKGYESLRPFIEALPQCFEEEGRIIYEGRNTVKVMEVDGYRLNVKRFLIPRSLSERIKRSYLRRSKCREAYLHALHLLEKGFETPQPIAYVEERKKGLIAYSYYVSFQSPYSHTFYELEESEIEECKDVIVSFARFTARLHEAGFLHKDYSPGNILFDRIDGIYHFSLVDINRMRLGKVSMKRGCKNFRKLWGKKELFFCMAKEYARMRGFDEKECANLIWTERKRFSEKRRPRYNQNYK